MVKRKKKNAIKRHEDKYFHIDKRWGYLIISPIYLLAPVIYIVWITLMYIASIITLIIYLSFAWADPTEIDCWISLVTLKGKAFRWFMPSFLIE